MPSKSLPAPSSLKVVSFAEFIGQGQLVNTLRVMINAAKAEQRVLDHVLLFGPPGLGKTTLATLVASELGPRLRFAQGPLLESRADLLALFGSLAANEVIFIDEIHSVHKSVEELLYSALDGNFIDVVLGVEGNAKIMRMRLPPFTLIGATTKIGKVARPLRDRFGLVAQLEPYSPSDLTRIINDAAAKMNVALEPGVAGLIALHSRATPRVAKHLLRRINDFRLSQEALSVSRELVYYTFDQINLFKLGLNAQQLAYLKLLSHQFEGKWVAIDTLCGTLLEEKSTIENQLEPHLFALGLVEKSSRGRRISSQGLNYLIDYNLRG